MFYWKRKPEKIPMIEAEQAQLASFPQVIEDEFQGFCLVQEAGWRTIKSYDQLPPHIRKRMRESPYNLCPACMAGFLINHTDNPEVCEKIFAAVEENIRKQEQRLFTD